MSATVTAQESKLLFRAFFANGLFSLVSGTVMLLFKTPVATFLGLQQPMVLTGLGAVLVLFGASLLFHAYRRRVSRTEAIAISAMDLGWVVGSILLVLFVPGLFSAAGISAVLVVAAIVFIFFELQTWALWKTRA